MRTIIAITILCFSSILSGQQQIYLSQSTPSFNFLYNNGHCYTAEDFSLYNDTTLSFLLLPQMQQGYLYYGYSSVGGAIGNVQYTQYDHGELISDSYFVFDGYDTLQIDIHISGSGIESFCPFFVPIIALPVTWGYVSASQNGSSIIASCQTLSESNTNKIFFEFSLDLLQWNKSEPLPMAGNSSLPNQYEIKVDVQQIISLLGNKSSNQVASSYIVTYGRFRQEDFNGEFSLSEIVAFVIHAMPKFNSLSIEGYDYSGRFLGL